MRLLLKHIRLGSKVEKYFEQSLADRMALSELEFNDRLAALKKYGVGVRDKDDAFFQANNAIIFKPYVRLGVYRFDKESTFHKS